MAMQSFCSSSGVAGFLPLGAGGGLQHSLLLTLLPRQGPLWKVPSFTSFASELLVKVFV